MLFRYPNSRQFPFDEVGEMIVHALEARNWRVPGIKVEFRQWGTGEEKYRYVSTIEGENFRIRFGIARQGVSTINIPRMEISVYSDESGPTLYLYMGDDYGRDHAKFMDGHKFNSKLDGKPRLYLRYNGVCRCYQEGASHWLAKLPHSHPGRRSPLLVHNNDLGREYDPEGNEPKEFATNDIFEIFNSWLTENVLKVIEAYPVPQEAIDIFYEASIPFPDYIGPLFTFGTSREAERILQGQEDPNKLEPNQRYALLMNRYGVGRVAEDTPIHELQIPGYYRRTGSFLTESNEEFVIRVRPNRANDVFIEDHAEFRVAYEKASLRRPMDPLMITRAEMDRRFRSAELAQRHSRVPIADYDGTFSQPVVVIERELEFDEVELLL